MPPANNHLAMTLARSVADRMPLRGLFALLLCHAAFVARAGGPYRTQTGLNAQVLDSLAAAGWVMDTDTDGSENTRLISSAVAVALGPFGAHRLYLGTTPKVAIVYGVTFGGFGILALVDLGHLLFTKDLDRFRNSDRVFMWNGDPAAVTQP